MCLRCQRHAIGADLVGSIAVGGNSVSTHDNGVHALGVHRPGSHIVGNQRHRDAILVQLKGCQACSLQQRPCFVSIHTLQLALLPGAAYNSQRRAPATGGKCASVAMRQNHCVLRQHGSAIFTHSLISGNIRSKNILRAAL